MRLERTPGFCALALAASLAAATGVAPGGQGDAARGRTVYDANCAVCHGAAGDGRGMAAHMLRTKPRDFSRGVFKFRSTPSGKLPTDADLIRAIRGGLPGSAMIPQDHLTAEEVGDVIAFLKTFSTRFAEEPSPTPIAIPPPPPLTEALLTRGHQIFRDMRCPECHGPEGRGDGPSADRMKDDLGQPLRPADLTRRPFKGGSSPEDLFRTLATGIGGTPMPSFEDAMDPPEIWAVVYHVLSLLPPDASPVPTEEERVGRMVEAMHQPRRR